VYVPASSERIDGRATAETLQRDSVPIATAGRLAEGVQLSDEYIARVLATMQERVSLPSDVFAGLCSYYFVEPDLSSAEARELAAQVSGPATGGSAAREGGGQVVSSRRRHRGAAGCGV
jgi:hypothetical protein